MFFTGITILVASIIFLLRLRKYSHFWRSLESFPGPRPLPIVGNALDFGTTTDMLPCFEKYRKTYGGICKVHIGPSRIYMIISDPALMEFVMSSNKLIDKSNDYKLFTKWLGTGLLTANGNKWRSRRKLITPTFHFKILEDFIETFHKCTNIFIDKLKKEVGKEETDVYPLVTLCSLDIICETAMGISINAQESKNTEYVTSVRDMSALIIKKSFSVWKNFEILYQFSNESKIENKLLETIRGTTNSVIKTRRQQLCNEIENKSKESIVEDDGSKKKIGFLDLLLQAKTQDGIPLSNEDIREEVDTFMFEGHDTTSSAIAFTLYCLANNPEVQDKAYQELNDIFTGDDKNKAASYADLQGMKYLDMIIKESLRIYPIVPFIGRNVAEDIEFQGKTIPAGVTLTLYTFGIHRNEKIFPDPEKFDPERFAPENLSKIPPYSYVPFSAGPRNCIGQKFAMLELKSVLSKVLRNFKLKPAPGHKIILSSETVLKSENGVFVKFENR